MRGASIKSRDAQDPVPILVTGRDHICPATPGPARPWADHAAVLFRGPGPDFSERDRAVLTLLRPQLEQAYLGAERRRHPVPRLTPRQQELLRLLTAGVRHGAGRVFTTPSRLLMPEQNSLGNLGQAVISPDGSRLYVTAELLRIAYERRGADLRQRHLRLGPLAIDPSGQHTLA
jgi:hypothetical protein